MEKDSETMMKAVILEAANKLTVKQIPIPKPANGQVLVRVMAAPINPSDLAFINVGKYSDTKKTPCTAGFQGSGFVVESGGGLMGWGLKNKKVAFTPIQASGTYAQYAIAKSDQCVPVEEDMSFEQASMSLVNPLTCIGFLDVAKTMGVKAIIHTAAASQLGRMVNRFFAPEKIKVINIVRRQEQVDLLKAEGAIYILNSSDEDFEEKFKKMAAELKATLCFDAIGGDMTGLLLKNMPKHSTAYIYGLLSQKPNQTADTVDMLYNDKTMKGFFLPNWLHTKGLMTLLPTMYRLRKLLKKELTSKIAKEVTLDDFESGMNYYLKNMTEGKVIVKPWMGAVEEKGQKEEKSENQSAKQSDAVEIKKTESSNEEAAQVMQKEEEHQEKEKSES